MSATLSRTLFIENYFSKTNFQISVTISMEIFVNEIYEMKMYSSLNLRSNIKIALKSQVALRSVALDLLLKNRVH